MPKESAVPYVFVGQEREVKDPQRYDRALRAWTGYLFQPPLLERPRRAPARPARED